MNKKKLIRLGIPSTLPTALWLTTHNQGGAAELCNLN